MRLALLVRHVSSRVLRGTLVVSAPTNATVRSQTLTGATIKQESVGAARVGRVNDATPFVRKVDGEKAAQRNAFVTRAPVNN